MKYILIIILVLLLSQTFKYVIRLFSSDQKINKKAVWTYLWATGAPSSHSAVLVSALMILYKDIGMSSIFIFCLVVSLIFMYNLVADRKRESIREEFFIRGGEIEKEIVLSGRVMDISGHSFFDIVTGIILGLVSTQLLLYLLL